MVEMRESYLSQANQHSLSLFLSSNLFGNLGMLKRDLTAEREVTEGDAQQKGFANVVSGVKTFARNTTKG
jgi:hypothetical protein